MNNRDMPAKPLDKACNDAIENGYGIFAEGLTKLEYAAIAAMKGLLSNLDSSNEDLIELVAPSSIFLANALFDELEKTND